MVTTHTTARSTTVLFIIKDMDTVITVWDTVTGITRTTVTGTMDTEVTEGFTMDGNRDRYNFSKVCN